MMYTVILAGAEKSLVLRYSRAGLRPSAMHLIGRQRKDIVAISLLVLLWRKRL